MLEFMKFTAHSLAEYRSLFSLLETELMLAYLDVGAGLSSFNSELTKLGGRVVSIDVLYDQDVKVVEEIVTKRDLTPISRGQLEPLDFLGNFDHKDLGIVRRQSSPAAKQFLADYVSGRRDNRYLWGCLPAVNFERNTFDMALCSHVLFCEEKPYSAGFHAEAINNMVHVAKECRIGPINMQDSFCADLYVEVEKELKSSRIKTELVENSFKKDEECLTLIARK